MSYFTAEGVILFMPIISGTETLPISGLSGFCAIIWMLRAIDEMPICLMPSLSSMSLMDFPARLRAISNDLRRSLVSFISSFILSLSKSISDNSLSCAVLPKSAKGTGSLFFTVWLFYSLGSGSFYFAPKAFIKSDSSNATFVSSSAILASCCDETEFCQLSILSCCTIDAGLSSEIPSGGLI